MRDLYWLPQVAVSAAAVFWAGYCWWRDRRRILSIRQVGSSITDRVMIRPNGLGVAFAIEVVVTNDSPRSTIVIAHYCLELPWNEPALEPLSDPQDLVPPKDHYEIPDFGVSSRRERVLNHRRYQYGKLAPGDAFRGFFLATGANPIPSDLLRPEGIQVRFVVQDTLRKRKRYRSGPMTLRPQAAPPAPASRWEVPGPEDASTEL